MLYGIYKNAEQTQLILILSQDGKRKRSKELWKRAQCFITKASVTKTAQRATVSIGTVINVTSALKMKDIKHQLWPTADIWSQWCTCMSAKMWRGGGESNSFSSRQQCYLNSKFTILYGILFKQFHTYTFNYVILQEQDFHLQHTIFTAWQ